MVDQRRRNPFGSAVLTRALQLVIVVLLAITALGVNSRAGYAEGGGGICWKKDPVTGKCALWIRDPGDPGGPGDPIEPPPGGGGDDGGPDYDPCTYNVLQPQPPAGDPKWAGHSPGEGAVYEKVCPRPDGAFGGYRISYLFVPNGDPPPVGVPIDPRVLAEQAIASMVMLAPEIRTAPPQGSDSGLVGLPVWLWTERGENVTGPVEASASAGGVTVVAVGEVAQIVWAMGDGQSVTCGAGTPYPAGSDGESPDCGYTYQSASANHVAGGGPWPITATSTWTITWSGGGESGTETLELTSTGELLIRELYVLNQDGG